MVRSRRRGRRLDALLLLDKSAGSSSNAALQRVRRLFDAAKAGHTGSLDPLATGLLPVCFGSATRLGGAWLDADKSYRTRIRLGVTTDSGDADGSVIERRAVPAAGSIDWEALLARFRGEIEQIPPMVSALKQGGQRLYRLARAGMEVDRPARRVRIDRLDLLACDDDTATLDIVCSKGTYVRSLAVDIGAAIGCGAHVETLRRTSVGDLGLSDAHAYETLEALPADARDACLLPADRLVRHLPAVSLDEAAVATFRHGGQVRVGMSAIDAPAGSHRIYDPAGRFLGLAEPIDTPRKERLLLQPRLVVADEACDVNVVP